MAEEENTEGGGEAQATEKAAPPKKALPILAIALGLQVVVILASMGVLVKVVLFTPRIKVTRELLGERAIASLRDDVEKIKIVDVEEMSVNLPDQRTVVARIQLEVSNEEVERELKKRMPALQAKFLDILGAHNSNFAETLQGKLLIKEKIRSAFNHELEKNAWDPTKGVVRDVLIVNMIMQ